MVVAKNGFHKHLKTDFHSCRKRLNEQTQCGFKLKLETVLNFFTKTHVARRRHVFG